MTDISVMGEWQVAAVGGTRPLRNVLGEALEGRFSFEARKYLFFFFPELCPFRRVFYFPRFWKNWRQTFKLWGFGFDDVLEILEVPLLVNPLWGHCHEYKIEKKAILRERLLSEKRSAFAYYNLSLSESFCLTDHEKQVQKFVAHWKVCQKSSQREVIRKYEYKAPKPQRVLLPALILKFSRSLTNFQASPGRQSSLRSKDRCPNHAVVWIAAGIERWQTVHFQLYKPDTRTRTAYNSTAGREDGGKRNFSGPKRQLFLQNEGFFKASTWSLVIQLHAREKWRRWVTITTKK